MDVEDGYPKVVVIDASAMSKGWHPRGGERVFTAWSVWNEILLGGTPLFEVKVVRPSRRSVSAVLETAMATGDDARLSKADVDLLALAIDSQGILITEDYSMQNVAEVLSIPWTSVGAPITEVRRWHYRCKGCLKVFDEPHETCPVCGSDLRSYGGPRR
ncbi:MAG TPA: hypothetical protein EYP43_01930 [Thermoplasmata archaeon]|nr:hypothetical protein [Thermoplasmata archaeon]